MVGDLSRNPVRIAFHDKTDSTLGRIRTAGFVESGGATLPRPRRVYDAYALVLVHGGAGHYFDDAVCRSIGPGDIIAVFPGFPHWYGPPKGGYWSETFLVFDGPIFDALAAGGVLDADHPVYRVGPVDIWQQRLRGFIERLSAGGTPQHLLDVLELARLLVELRVAREEPPDVPRSIRQARELLTRDLSAELQLAELSATVGLPYETFRKRFKAATGQSPGSFRLNLRIDAAKSLLRMTTLTHEAIATSLGFADEHHFAKSFRTRVGTSPSSYRQAHIGG